MNRLLLVVALASATPAVSAEKADLANPAIDSQGFRLMTNRALDLRETHRVSEAEFIRMSRQKGTIVLDARSAEKFAELHVRGAVNLSFPDITIESVQRVLPDKTARILIYCNNNFTGAERAFGMKRISAALNLSTYTSLYTYGYRNIYELGPLLDVAKTKLELEGTSGRTTRGGTPPRVEPGSARGPSRSSYARSSGPSRPRSSPPTVDGRARE
jgi:phage shock protein E